MTLGGGFVLEIITLIVIYWSTCIPVLNDGGPWYWNFFVVCLWLRALSPLMICCCCCFCAAACLSILAGGEFKEIEKDSESDDS